MFSLSWGQIIESSKEELNLQEEILSQEGAPFRIDISQDSEMHEKWTNISRYRPEEKGEKASRGGTNLNEEDF
jgi:hypothetical protein